LAHILVIRKLVSGVATVKVHINILHSSIISH